MAYYFYIGALATLVASYLARARGSNEPELSNTRVKNLEQFIRECKAFLLDYGHTYEHDKEVVDLRRRLEEVLGNSNRWSFFFFGYASL